MVGWLVGWLVGFLMVVLVGWSSSLHDLPACQEAAVKQAMDVQSTWSLEDPWGAGAWVDSLESQE